jgi:hypothetical protein
MRHTSYFWGAILLLAGILLLLQNLGLLAVDFWQILWPAVIILGGAWLLWGATRGRKTLPSESFRVPLDGAEKLRLDLHYGAGRLHLEPGSPAVSALEGTFEGGVEHEVRRQGAAIVVDLRVPTDRMLDFVPWGTDHGLDWAVLLSESPDIELNVDAGASENRLDLERLHVSRLTFKTGASATYIRFSERPENAQAEISLGAASAELTIPAGVSASIRIKSGLSGIKVDERRFPKRGEVYESVDFESAPHRLTLGVESGVGSVEIM